MSTVGAVAADTTRRERTTRRRRRRRSIDQEINGINGGSSASPSSTVADDAKVARLPDTRYYKTRAHENEARDNNGAIVSCGRSSPGRTSKVWTRTPGVLADPPTRLASRNARYASTDFPVWNHPLLEVRSERFSVALLSSPAVFLFLLRNRKRKTLVTAMAIFFFFGHKRCDVSLLNNIKV